MTQPRAVGTAWSCWSSGSSGTIALSCRVGVWLCCAELGLDSVMLPQPRRGPECCLIFRCTFLPCSSSTQSLVQQQEAGSHPPQQFPGHRAVLCLLFCSLPRGFRELLPLCNAQVYLLWAESTAGKPPAGSGTGRGHSPMGTPPWGQRAEGMQARVPMRCNPLGWLLGDR